MYYTMSADYFQSALSLKATSTTAQPKLNKDDVKLMALPLPSINEQELIVHFLDNQSSEIDGAIYKAEKQIELLQEYRTALISEAVTGKIDVREAV